MSTARLLPVSPSMHCAGGMYLQVVYLIRGDYLSLVWGVPAQGVPASSPGGGYLSRYFPSCEQNDWKTGVKT